MIKIFPVNVSVRVRRWPDMSRKERNPQGKRGHMSLDRPLEELKTQSILAQRQASFHIVTHVQIKPPLCLTGPYPYYTAIITNLLCGLHMHHASDAMTVWSKDQNR